MLSVTAISNYTMAQDETNVDQKDSGIIYDPSNKNVYVIDENQRSLTAINASNHIVGTVFVGEEPIFIAYNPDNKNLYVTDHFDGKISVLNSSNSIITTLIPDEDCAGDCWPEEIAYNPFDKNVYVTLPFNDTINVYNANNILSGRIYTNTDRYRLLSSEHMAFDAKNNKTYITNSNSHAISVLNGSDQSVKEIDVGDTQNLIMYVPFTRNAYVSLGDRFYHPNGTVSIINTTNDQVSYLKFDEPTDETYIEDMSFNLHNRQIYFAGSKGVYVADPANHIVSTVPVGAEPCSIAYNPANNNTYVGTRSSSVVVINDTHQIVSTVPVGAEPCSIVYNPANGYIYTRNEGSATVSVISNANQVIATIPIPFLSPEKYPS